ncbi:MAG: preprotein translocase subunit YajC [Chloroflexi bacterium]|nr:preprotein translocase subunit YajC [Chloroflexota bacterium]
MTPLSQMIQLVVLTASALGAVYFIFYRPTVQREIRQRRVVAGLRPGDEIVTTSGFIGTIVDVREPDDGSVELLLDLGDGRLVRARPSAVEERLPRPEDRDEAPADVDDAEEEPVVPADVMPVTAGGLSSPAASKDSNRDTMRGGRRRARAAIED